MKDSNSNLPRISILGGGWLGAPLAQYLEARGYTTRLSTASQERYEQLQQTHKQVYQINVEHDRVQGDWAAFAQAEVLVINIPPDRSNPDKGQFDALITQILASPIKRVLLVSSTSVYPNVNRVVLENEADTTSRLYRNEQAFRQLEEFDTTVLRLAGLIGGERHPGRFFRHSGRIKQSDAPVNLIHRECLHQIIAQNYWGEVVNACADTHPLKMDFYPTAAAAIGMPVPVLEQQGKISYKLVSNQKMKSDLGIVLKEPDLMALLGHWH